MCHEQFHRVRVWDSEESIEDLTEQLLEDEPADDRKDADPTAELAEEDLPSFLADEEPDDELDVLTDGGA